METSPSGRSDSGSKFGSAFISSAGRITGSRSAAQVRIFDSVQLSDLNTSGRFRQRVSHWLMMGLATFVTSTLTNGLRDSSTEHNKLKNFELNFIKYLNNLTRRIHQMRREEPVVINRTT